MVPLQCLLLYSLYRALQDDSLDYWEMQDIQTRSFLSFPNISCIFCSRGTVKLDLISAVGVEKPD